MKISEVCLAFEKCSNYLITGKPISVYYDGHDINMVCEEHDFELVKECDVYLFTHTTKMTDEDAEGLIFLGTVYLPNKHYAVHVFYKLGSVKYLEKVKEPDSYLFDRAYVNFNYIASDVRPTEQEYVH